MHPRICDDVNRLDGWLIPKHRIEISEHAWAPPKFLLGLVGNKPCRGLVLIADSDKVEASNALPLALGQSQDMSQAHSSTTHLRQYQSFHPQTPKKHQIALRPTLCRLW